MLAVVGIIASACMPSVGTLLLGTAAETTAAGALAAGVINGATSSLVGQVAANTVAEKGNLGRAVKRVSLVETAACALTGGGRALST